nr:RNA-dependent RNA polymerase [Molussus totiviridae 1]
MLWPRYQEITLYPSPPVFLRYWLVMDKARFLGSAAKALGMRTTKKSRFIHHQPVSQKYWCAQNAQACKVRFHPCATSSPPAPSCFWWSGRGRGCAWVKTYFAGLSILSTPVRFHPCATSSPPAPSKT